ncbi:MAG TPA: transcription elongation factor [Rariglobus sp.]|jgi:transcription elongation GreA/GreB family factor|nr:transcription elongation factor [Rariglobus sp.]
MVSLDSAQGPATISWMQKSTLRDAIVAQLHRELELQARAAYESRDEATSAENKAEGQYDMRSQEAAYLAEGQARLATEIAESISVYQTLDLPEFTGLSPAAVGALITLEAKGRKSFYFLGPRNGGLEARAGDLEFVVVTPASPLGRQFLGRRTGDTVQLPGRGGPVVHQITAIQ